MPYFLWELPQEDGHNKRPSTSLIQTFPFLLLKPLHSICASFTHVSHTLSLHLPSGLHQFEHPVSLKYTISTNFNLHLPDVTKSWDVSFYPPSLHTSLHSYITNLSLMLSLLSPSHLHIPHLGKLVSS